MLIGHVHLDRLYHLPPETVVSQRVMIVSGWKCSLIILMYVNSNSISILKRIPGSLGQHQTAFEYDAHHDLWVHLYSLMYESRWLSDLHGKRGKSYAEMTRWSPFLQLSVFLTRILNNFSLCIHLIETDPLSSLLSWLWLSWLWWVRYFSRRSIASVNEANE